jgi:hypothetical protein
MSVIKISFLSALVSPAQETTFQVDYLSFCLCVYWVQKEQKTGDLFWDKKEQFFNKISTK